MPFRTDQGKHWHTTPGCPAIAGRHVSMCGTDGLAPCTICTNEGSGGGSGIPSWVAWPAEAVMGFAARIRSMASRKRETPAVPQSASNLDKEPPQPPNALRHHKMASLGNDAPKSVEYGHEPVVSEAEKSTVISSAGLKSVMSGASAPVPEPEAVGERLVEVVQSDSPDTQLGTLPGEDGIHAAARAEWRRVAPSERPQHGHLDAAHEVVPSTPAEHADYLGLDSEDEAHLMAYAAAEYCGKRYKEIRRCQAEGIQSDWADRLEGYIEHAPKWAGGETWRGIGVDRQLADSILALAETHGTYDPNGGGTGSWSTDEQICEHRGRYMAEERRINEGGESVCVLFSCPTQSRGTSVKHLSRTSEDEVLVSKDSAYRVASAEYEDGGRLLRVRLDEEPAA